MEKTFKRKNFNNFVWTTLGSRVNIYINFCLQVHFKVSAAWYCCHYLPPVSLTPVANLPPVSTMLAKMVEKFAADTGPVSLIPAAILLPVSLTQVANLPPVSLIPVVHLDSRISPRIFEKNSKRSKWNTLGLGGNWFKKKNQKQKISWNCPFNRKASVIPNRNFVCDYFISDLQVPHPDLACWFKGDSFGADLFQLRHSMSKKLWSFDPSIYLVSCL